ncbi:MAG: xanthine dehydrogenase family protein subunit M [Smithella sp.]
MKNFDFINAASLDDAIAILAEKGEKACLCAGATNVMVDIRTKKINDKVLVNIRDIAELKGINFSDGIISIGALTPIAVLTKSDILKGYAPALFMAANDFADPVTINSATIGGNIADASPAADTAPSLLVLDAKINVVSKKGKREIPVDQFFKGVRKTDLAPDEIITSISFIPAAASGFYKIGLRNAMAISVATAAAFVKLDKNGNIADCKLALGSVAPTPIRAKNAEAFLNGKKPDKETLAGMAEAIQEDINPIDDIRATAAYRRQVAPVCAKRAINFALYGECQ